MVLDKLSSERLSILRFPLIIGVVLIHSAGTTMNFADGSSGSEELLFFFNFIQNILSDGIARVAVPLFFLMSGFLFFLNVKWSIDKFKEKVRSRFYTLVIPFLFWNMFVMVVFFIAQTIPQTSVYFSGTNQSIATYSLFDFFNNLLGLTKSPISFQFWFIRDLIVMILLTPLLICIFKSKILATLMLFLLSCLWLLDVWPIYIPSLAAVYFFYVGSYISKFEIDIFSMDRFGSSIFVIYLVFLLADTMTKNYEINQVLHHIGIVLGVITSLYISKSFCGKARIKNLFLRLSTYAFFIFALHEPLLRIFKKLIYKLISPESELAIIFIYFFVPLVIIFTLIFTYEILNKLAPRQLRAVVGGR